MWFNPEYERNARVGSYYWEPNWDRLEANDKETIEFYEGRERIVNAYYKMKTKELAEICRNMDLSPDGKTKEAFILAIVDNQGLLD